MNPDGIRGIDANAESFFPSLTRILVDGGRPSS
jgi:hypothetical protein